MSERIDETEADDFAPRARPNDPRPNIEAGASVRPLIPRTFDEVLRYARLFITAKAIPDSLSKDRGRELSPEEVVARVFMVISAGAEIGLAPNASLRRIAIINNQTYIWGAGAVACLQSSGKLEYMQVEKIGSVPTSSTATDKYSDDYGVRVTLKRRGQPIPYTSEYTVGMAKRAHLWMNVNKKPWIENPDRQLHWRAFHPASVDGFSDCLNGMVPAEIALEEPEGPPEKTDTSFLDAGLPPSGGQRAIAAPTEIPMPGPTIPEPTSEQVAEHIVAERDPLPVSAAVSTSTAAPAASSPTPPATGELIEQTLHVHAGRERAEMPVSASRADRALATRAPASKPTRHRRTNAEVRAEREAAAMRRHITSPGMEAYVARWDGNNPVIDERPVTRTVVVGEMSGQPIVRDVSHDPETGEITDAEREDGADPEPKRPEAHDEAYDVPGSSSEPDTRPTDGGASIARQSPVDGSTGNPVSHGGARMEAPASTDPVIASWWRLATQAQHYTMKMDTRNCDTIGRGQLIALIEATPDRETLDAFATANQRNIQTIQLSSKPAANDVRAAITRKLAEFGS
jgi:hypothetical protein